MRRTGSDKRLWMSRGERMRYTFLIIGTILAILFIIQLIRGEKFESMVENLDEDKFPLNGLYGAGFAWSSGKLFKLQGKRAADLYTQASLLYEPQYAEYYANVTWAQTITLVHLFIAITFLMAGILYDAAVFMFIAGIFMSVLIAAYCLENMKNTLSQRAEECESQLPEAVSTMAVLVNSGMVLRDAWHMIAESGNGAFYELMRKVGENMKKGCSDFDVIFLFGKTSNSTEIKKFTSALLQSMEKGGAEIAVFLANQSSELWSAKRQRMLQSGEKASAKLLLPMALIFLGVIIIVMTAAFVGSLF